MGARSTRIAARALAVGIAAGGIALPAAAQEILPLAEVRAGMVGEGRTVFHGAEIETFGVEILGVLRNPMPGRSIILARVSGGPLERTGVMQGMSGSPVYIDGRLVGALAYAFPYSLDPVGGITPFEEMVRFTELPPSGGGAAAVAGRLRFSDEGIPFFDPTPGAEFEVASNLAAGAAPPDSPAAEESRLLPLATPVSASGLAPAAHRALAPVFRQLGMELASGGAAVGWSVSAQDPAAAPRGTPLAPGSPVGATLIGGDLAFMASGTVTHVDAETGEVFAFGHPFTGLGTLSIPMQEARVEASIASRSASFKLASGGREIGVWRQDRATAIRGELGARARTIPLRIAVSGSRGGRRDYRLELASHDLLTPLLAYAGMASVLAQEERLAGPQTLRLSARFAVGGGRTLAIGDRFGSGLSGVVLEASALVAAPIALLLGNPLERIPVEEVEVEVVASETGRTATLTRIWTPSTRVRPGETLTLRVAARDFRGAERVRSIEVPIPEGAAGQTLHLVAADAASALFEDRLAGAVAEPTRVEQIFRAIANHRQQDQLHVRLLGPGRGGAVMGGAYLPSLPPSVRSVLSRDASGGRARTLSNSMLWEGRLEFDSAISGSRRLAITVAPR